MLGAALPLGQGGDRGAVQFAGRALGVHREAAGRGGPVTTEYAAGSGLFGVGEHQRPGAEGI